jgi:hypothetical protein
MDTPVLGDPEVYPSDEVLGAKLGRSKAAFDALFEKIRAGLPDLEEGWKYYQDGKSWLLKVSRKKKTLFWLSVREGSFRTTFYLGAGAEAAVMGSGLPEEPKEQFRASAAKKFHGVTVEVKAKKDLAAFEELLGIKLDDS